MNKIFLMLLYGIIAFPCYGQIIGGSSTTIEDVPYQVSIEIGQNSGCDEHRCGGSIISDLWILTAAHCVDDDTAPEDIMIHAGSTDHTDNDEGQRIQVEEIIINEDYTGLVSEGADIALLRLSQALCFDEKVQPIVYATSSMPESIYAEGNVAKLSGWGKAIVQGVLCPDIIRSASLPLISQADANDLLGNCNGVHTVMDHMIAFYSGGSSIGAGDSGGPAAIMYQNEPLQIGITSWGCGSPSFPSVYTKVSSYSDFIDANITETEPCLLCSDTKKDVLISGIETLVDTQVSGDIIVEDGAVLTIDHDVQFSENSSLIVESGGKVIIDDAKLFPCDQAESWIGVKVAGSWAIGFYPDPPGEIDLINGAVISNAEIGIDGTSSTPFFNYNIEHGGGIITMDDSYIQNCNIGIKLAPYGYSGPFVYGGPGEQSEIINSFIENCNIGIFADNNNGLNLENTEFNSNILIDIESFGSSFNLRENTFHKGVDMWAVYATLYGSEIHENLFYDEEFFISTQGNFTKMDIFKNAFIGETNTLWIEGDLDFNIEKNDYIDCGIGNFTYFTGDNIDNTIQNNLFKSNTWANTVVGSNDTEYLTNCFEATYEIDIELADNSSIYEVQLTDEDDLSSAGNCFQVDAAVQTGINTAFFEYWTKEGYAPTPTCENPGNTGNFEKVEADIETPADNCGTNLVYPNTDPTNAQGCSCDPATEECTDAIEDLEEDISILENDDTINFWVKRKLLAQYRRCLDRLIKIYTVHLLEVGELEEAIVLLQGRPELRYRSMAYGIIISTVDYDRARIFINGLTATTQEEVDFVHTQNIYLDYITDRVSYVLTEEDKYSLYNAGKGANPTSGFARSLYYRLTEEKIDVDYAHIDGSTSPRLVGGKSVEKVAVYPNPVSGDNVKISIDGLDTDADYTALIYNALGELISSRHITNMYDDVVLGEGKGLFVLAIHKNGKVLKTEKIIKL